MKGSISPNPAGSACPKGYYTYDSVNKIACPQGTIYIFIIYLVRYIFTTTVATTITTTIAHNNFHNRHIW